MNDRRLAETERLGWRNAWLPEALEFDTRLITRWFRLDAVYYDNAGTVTLFSRVLGWDVVVPVVGWRKIRRSHHRRMH